MKRKMTIIGGGLSGLALANGLRMSDVPVEVLEAGRYPRHRVCGEFLTSLSSCTLEGLGISDCFHDAVPHNNTVWFRNGQVIRQYDMPVPAMGISRHALDLRLADMLVKRGGTIREQTRGDPEAREGRIFATGRAPTAKGYFGLKGHWRGLETAADLELHLGRHAYVGLSSVETGCVNVCGLFRSVSTGEYDSPMERFHATLREHDLVYLSDRLRSSSFQAGSFCSISGLSYGHLARQPANIIGDRHRMIPPFTGNGMTLAFEKAYRILPLVIEYAEGKLTWDQFLEQSSKLSRKGLNRRYVYANLLHPFLLKPSLQSILCHFSRFRLVPFAGLYRLTHT